MSTWNEFKNLAVKVSSDPNKPPRQWIYAVDDAWLHPVGIALTGSVSTEIKMPVFPRIGAFTPLEWNERYSQILFGQGADADTQSRIAPTQNADNLKVENIADANVANMLVEYAIEGKYRSAQSGEPSDERGKAGHSFTEYGVCFCSFEYFWEHFSEINQSFNAIIFDLRHALREQGDLASIWLEKLKGTGLFGEDNMNMSNLHGWMLHFAAKLHRINSIRCRINPNHILILSSNLMGARATDGSDSMQAFQQYSTIQRDLWEHLSSDAGNLPDAHIVDFSFCPLPKNTEGLDQKASLLDKGLEVFDRTFRMMGCWSAVRRLFEHDLEWAKNRATENGKIHFKSEHEPSKNELHWTIWTGNVWLDDMKAAYDEELEGNGSRSPSVDLFVRIVKASGIRGVEDFSPPKDSAPLSLKFPAKPEIELIAMVLDFLDALTPAPSEWIIRGNETSGRRESPKYSLKLHDKQGALVLNIKIPKGGIDELKKSMENKTTGASPIAKKLNDFGLLSWDPNETSVNITIPFHNI